MSMILWVALFHFIRGFIVYSIFNILIMAYLIMYFVYMLWCLLALTII